MSLIKRKNCVSGDSEDFLSAVKEIMMSLFSSRCQKLNGTPIRMFHLAFPAQSVLLLLLFLLSSSRPLMTPCHRRTCLGFFQKQVATLKNLTLLSFYSFHLRQWSTVSLITYYCNNIFCCNNWDLLYKYKVARLFSQRECCIMQCHNVKIKERCIQE